VPGPSGAQESVEGFRKLLEAQDARASAQVVRAYAPVYRQLQRDTQALVKIAQAQGLKPWQAMRMQRMKDLEKQFLASASRFSKAAGDTVTASQRAAVGLGRRGARQAVAAGLPRGVTMENLANIGLEWNRLPEEAFTNFVGISADGQPIGDLLAPLGPEAAAPIKDAIGNGIALGKSPRETAQLMRVAAGIPLSRALLIARTETNRAFRESTRLQYANNSQVVTGYRRMATKDDTTCMACIALDGTLYKLDEPLNEHPNGRCAIVPETISYRDLGLDVEMPPQPENGQSWFMNQGKAVQKRMLGPSRFRAYQTGDLNLTDLVEIRSSPIWGDAAGVASLRNTLVKAAGKKQPVPLTKWIEIHDKAALSSKISKAAKKAGIPEPPAFIPAPKRPPRPRKPKQVEPEPSKYSKVNKELENMKLPLGNRNQADLIVNANRQKLGATREGEEINQAVNRWISGGNEGHREGAAKWMAGEDVTGVRSWQTGAQLAEAAANGSRSRHTLYRGIKTYGDTIEDVEAIYSKGAVFDSHISSFSRIYEKAASPEFAGVGTDQANASVVFKLQPGARGLNIEPISSYIGEAETIISGRFEVVGTYRTMSIPEGGGRAVGRMRVGEILHVEIRQTQSLVEGVK
jgi:SPP1 gp7 family putative phage head morphogenesis protein